jgi:hypothetical protein
VIYERAFLLKQSFVEPVKSHTYSFVYAIDEKRSNFDAIEEIFKAIFSFDVVDLCIWAPPIRPRTINPNVTPCSTQQHTTTTQPMKHSF